jgi:hypothetical protein
MRNGDGEEWKDGQVGRERGNILKPIIDSVNFHFKIHILAAGLRPDPLGSQYKLISLIYSSLQHNSPLESSISGEGGDSLHE